MKRKKEKQEKERSTGLEQGPYLFMKKKCVRVEIIGYQMLVWLWGTFACLKYVAVCLLGKRRCKATKQGLLNDTIPGPVLVGPCDEVDGM